MKNNLSFVTILSQNYVQKLDIKDMLLYLNYYKRKYKFEVFSRLIEWNIIRSEPQLTVYIIFYWKVGINTWREIFLVS